MFNMSKEERAEMGKKGMKHIEDNYNFKTFQKQWIDLMLGVHEKYGSWKDRKNYKSWDLMEIE